jgi:hypothetical protein
LINGVGIENKISRNTIMPRKKMMKGCDVEGTPVMQEGGGLYAGRGVKMMEKMAEDSVEGMGLYAGRGMHVHHHHHHHRSESPEGGRLPEFVKTLGKKALKEAIHHGAPKVAGVLGAKAGMVLGGPAGAVLGAKLGHDLGSMGAEEAKKAIGEGLYAGRGIKKPYMIKGSPEAKAHMQRLREMRRKK